MTTRKTLRTTLGWALLRVRRGEHRAAPLVVAGFVTVLLTATLGALLWNVQSTVTADEVGGGSLAVLELRTDVADARPLTGSALDLLAGLPDVAAVEPAIDGASIYGADGGWVLPVVAFQASQAPPGVTAPPGPGEFLAPSATQGVDFAALVGEELDVGFTTRTGADEGESASRRLRLSGTYDPSWQVYGPAVALTDVDTAVELVAAREGLSPRAYLDERGVRSALVVARDREAVPALTADLRARGFAASPLADRLGLLPGVFSLLPAATAIVAVVGLLLLVVSTFTGVAASVRVQLRDLALLRVHGWQVSDIRALITTESMLVTGLGAVAGALVAIALVPFLSVVAAEQVGAQPALGDLVWRPVLIAAGAMLISLLASAGAATLASRRSLSVDPYIAVRAEGG